MLVSFPLASKFTFILIETFGAQEIPPLDLGDAPFCAAAAEQDAPGFSFSSAPQLVDATTVTVYVEATFPDGLTLNSALSWTEYDVSTEPLPAVQLPLAEYCIS